MKRRRPVKEGFLNLKTIKTWGVCVPCRGGMGNITCLSAYEQVMVVGARRTGLCQELQCGWVFHAQQCPVCIKNGPPPKEHPADLTQLWQIFGSTLARIPVERFQHLVESMPQRI